MGLRTRGKFVKHPPLVFVQRLFAKIDMGDECWLWQGKLDDDGYGKTTVDRRPRHAYKVIFELLVGAVPKNHELDHLCRVRACVNPTHLEVVTKRVNVLRGMSIPAQNARKKECKRGHPLSGDNLYVRRNGFRKCRACAAWYEKSRRSA